MPGPSGGGGRSGGRGSRKPSESKQLIDSVSVPVQCEGCVLLLMVQD